MRSRKRVGGRGLRRLAVLAAACTFAAAAQAPEDVRVALVIGNAAYAGDAALANPRNDAAAMGATLRTLGFAVTELHDGTQAQMQEAVARLRGILQGKRAIGMLFYAGHGVQVDFRNYMVPVDAKLATVGDVPVQTLDVAQVIDAFKSAQTRMNILVLDACRDNPFAKSSGKGLAPLDAPSGTLLAFATAPGNVAEDGEPLAGNSVYTSFLVKELQKPAAKIEDVFKRVRLQVRRHSNGRQIPWETTSLEEDFYFNDGARHTFGPEDFEQVRLAAQQRLQALERHAREAARAEEQAAARKALEALRASEAQRLRELEQAAALARERQRLQQLSAEKARDEAFRLEKAGWDRIRASRNPEDFYAFLAKYPSGTISELAQARLDGLQKAGIQAQPLPGQAPQDASAPLYRLGDRFEYEVKDGLTGVSRGRIVRAATKVDDEVAEFSTENVPNLFTQRGAVHSDTVGTYDPPLSNYPAGELQVGKKWSSRSNFVGRKDGYRGWIDIEGKVAAFEEIRVSIGTVKAYRVELLLQFESGTREKRTHWLEPGWGYPVRSHFETRYPGGSAAPSVVHVDLLQRRRGS